MAGRTVIVIAHRLSTAERSDRVGVVDAGGLLELGPHEELLALGGRYYDLYRAWAGHQPPERDWIHDAALDIDDPDDLGLAASPSGS